MKNPSNLPSRLAPLFAALGLLLAACSGDDDDSLPDINTLFPANNEVGSWVENTAIGEPGVETATDDSGTDVPSARTTGRSGKSAGEPRTFSPARISSGVRVAPS